MSAEPRTSEREKLPRVVWLVGWVSFFADVSSELMYPLLPLFVVGVLGASRAELGWIEGLAAAIVAVMTGLSGWRSDRSGRRVPWIRAGYGLPVLGKALIACAGAWSVVLAGRMLDRLGKGLRTSSRDALLADAVHSGQRGRAFGLHRAMDTAGAFVGVLLSAAILLLLNGDAGSEHVGDGPEIAPISAPAPGGAGIGGTNERVFRVAFGVAAALGLVSLALTLLLQENARDGSRTQRILADEPPVAAVASTRLGPAYWVSMAPLLVFALANSSDAFVLLRAKDLGHSAWVIVLMYALYNLTYTLFSYPAGVISDRIGRWRVIALGWVIYSLAYAGFALASSGWMWLLMGVYGVYMALTDGVAKALIADLAPRERRGTALGVYYMCTGGAALAGSVLTGVLWDRFGAPVALGACAAGSAIAVALVGISAWWRRAATG